MPGEWRMGIGNTPDEWKTGVLIWCHGTTVGARTTYSGVKYEISGARAW